MAFPAFVLTNKINICIFSVSILVSNQLTSADTGRNTTESKKRVPPAAFWVCMSASVLGSDLCQCRMALYALTALPSFCYFILVTYWEIFGIGFFVIILIYFIMLFFTSLIKTQYLSNKNIVFLFIVPLVAVGNSLFDEGLESIR